MKSPTKGRPRLSNAQRNLLHARLQGRMPAHRPETMKAQGRMPAHRPETMQALHRRRLVAGIDHQPTPAGAAIFAPRPQPPGGP